MADGRHGYNVSVGYTATFFAELAPHWLDFCMRAQGFDSPGAGASYRYADLGCGAGFHLCLLAAANPQAEFVGVDFDADFTRSQKLAEEVGLTNVRFVQADFLDLAESWPAELGTFDYLVLQGILSWVSAEVRAAALRCVAQASKPGTIASFGYNCPPGWLSTVPFQHVANRFGKNRDPNAAIGGAIGMFRRLGSANAPFFERMPHFKASLDAMAAQPPSYLAHEFLPDHWTALWHSDVAQQLRGLDFTFVGSANVAEALLPNSLPPELAAIINEQTDDLLRQDVQDIAIVQRFRRDIFCRDPRASKSSDLDGEAPIHLLSPPKEGAPVQFRTTFGGLTVDYGVVADILAALADGPKPAEALMALKNPARLNTRSILLSMIDADMITVGSRVPGSTEIAARFNAAVARGAAGGESYRNLAAAALGSGIAVAELDLLLLDTWLSAGSAIAPEELARGVAQRLRALGRKLQFRGGPIADKQLEPHIAGLAPIFFDQLLPQWRRLGVLQ
jgi:SAM-dependent methyltransferase